MSAAGAMESLLAAEDAARAALSGLGDSLRGMFETSGNRTFVNELRAFTAAVDWTVRGVRKGDGEWGVEGGTAS